MSKDYLPYLKTLRRIPAPIIQAMATREIEPMDSAACICGWAIREAIAFANGHTADMDDDPHYTSWAECRSKFGGTSQEWADIYGGIGSFSSGPHIEQAFVMRVMECVR